MFCEGKIDFEDWNGKLDERIATSISSILHIETALAVHSVQATERTIFLLADIRAAVARNTSSIARKGYVSASCAVMKLVGCHANTTRVVIKIVHSSKHHEELAKDWLGLPCK